MASRADNVWGELVRRGGVEDVAKVPSILPLTDETCFVGRIATPDPANENKFTHTIQYVLDCPFISSTHFAIQKHKDRDHYTIFDYSRNGTFVDGELVGMNQSKDLKEGSEITLRYKNKVKITYFFASLSNNNRLSLTPPTAAVGVAAMNVVVDHPSATSDNAANTLLAQQITSLQADVQSLEEKLQQQTELTDGYKREIDKHIRKAKHDEKKLESVQQSLQESVTRCQELDLEVTTKQARIISQENSLEDIQAELSSYRQKCTKQAEEIAEKQTQLQKYRERCDENNRVLTAEVTIRTVTQAALQAIQKEYSLLKEQVARYAMSNSALQEELADTSSAQARCESLLSLYHSMLLTVQETVREKCDYNTRHALQMQEMMMALQRIQREMVAQEMYPRDEGLAKDLQQFLQLTRDEKLAAAAMVTGGDGGAGSNGKGTRGTQDNGDTLLPSNNPPAGSATMRPSSSSSFKAGSMKATSSSRMMVMNMTMTQGALEDEEGDDGDEEDGKKMEVLHEEGRDDEEKDEDEDEEEEEDDHHDKSRILDHSGIMQDLPSPYQRDYPHYKDSSPSPKQDGQAAVGASSTTAGVTVGADGGAGQEMVLLSQESNIRNKSTPSKSSKNTSAKGSENSKTMRMDNEEEEEEGEEGQQQQSKKRTATMMAGWQQEEEGKKGGKRKVKRVKTMVGGGTMAEEGEEEEEDEGESEEGDEEGDENVTRANSFIGGDDMMRGIMTGDDKGEEEGKGVLKGNNNADEEDERQRTFVNEESSN